MIYITNEPKEIFTKEMSANSSSHFLVFNRISLLRNPKKNYFEEKLLKLLRSKYQFTSLPVYLQVRNIATVIYLFKIQIPEQYVKYVQN